MPLGRPAPRSDRSDRSRDRSDRSETHNPSQELYFDTGFDRVPTPNEYIPPHPIYMKGYGRLRVIPIDSHIYPLSFTSKPQLFQTHLLFFLRFYGVRGCSKWPADLRATLAPLAPMGSLPSLWFQIFAVSKSTDLTGPHDRFDRSAKRSCWC